MRRVYVDTSGFYAALAETDPNHDRAVGLFERGAHENWEFCTTNYVILECRALVQNRLRWDAIDEMDRTLLPLCKIEFVDRALHLLGEERWRHARERTLSLTDCVSLAYLRREGVREAIVFDAHFARERITLP